jgi:long-chain acyl-CoA synthetase
VPAASFKSFPEMFHHRVRSTPDAEAFSFRRGGQWTSTDWRGVGERVRAIACGLHALGIEAEQRAAILCSTRVEWVYCDLGILCAGGACTTIYPSCTADECAYILSDSGTRFVFAENEKQVAKLREVRSKIPAVAHIIVLDGTPGDGVITLAALEEKGKAWDAANPGAYDRSAEAVGPDQLATLIYTSGTTGPPKGVMLTHDNWVYEGEAIDAIGLCSPADKQYLWLPLAHSFGKVLECMIIRIGIPTAIDGDIDSLVDNLAAVRPTMMGAAPRIFEKVYNKVVSGAKEAGGLKYAIFQWAIGVGRRVSKLRQAGQEPGGLLALQNAIADKLVFSKLKARFGGRVRFFISGSAALNREIAEFFHACGILVLEGYGLTESSAASFVNRLDDYRFGTVGKPVPGTELKIADDGEILIRGRGIMRGYYNLAEASAETLKDGWLCTGDIGEVQDGFLKITDRKKDLIKTSGGKYVAPQELEGRIKARCTLVSQVVVHGNNRNFCSALVAIAEDSARGFLKQSGVEGLAYPQMAEHPAVRAEIEAAIKSLNAELPSYSTIKTFALLEADLTLEAGELTPSLKVKRKAVEAKYKHVLDGFYAGSVQQVN